MMAHFLCVYPKHQHELISGSDWVCSTVAGRCLSGDSEVWRMSWTSTSRCLDRKGPRKAAVPSDCHLLREFFFMFIIIQP